MLKGTNISRRVSQVEDHVLSAREARQGTGPRAMVVVLVVSLVLACVAGILIATVL